MTVFFYVARRSTRMALLKNEKLNILSSITFMYRTFLLIYSYY